MAKFVINNNNFSSIKLFLLFTLKNLYLYMSFNIVNLLDTIIYE